MITNMAFAEPTVKKARLDKTNAGVFGKDISSNFQRNQQNSDVESSFFHRIQQREDTRTPSGARRRIHAGFSNRFLT